jgi:hypothetical protein
MFIEFRHSSVTRSVRSGMDGGSYSMTLLTTSRSSGALGDFQRPGL